MDGIEYDYSRRPSQRTLVELMDPESIIKCCFIVHKSVSYLDLSISHHSTLIRKRGLERCLKGMFRSFPDLLTTTFICTEEHLRRIFAPKRRLLYLYHLDLPKGRERSLRRGRPRDQSLIACSRIYFLRAYPCLYKRKFWLYIQEAVKHSNRKVDLILRLLKPMKFIVLINHFFTLVYQFLEILYSRCTNSEVFVKFISQIDFREWLLYNSGRRYILESILFHCYKCKYYLLEQMPFCCDPINMCMITGKFDLVAVLLRYRDAPRFAIFPCEDMAMYMTRQPARLLEPVFEGLISSRRLLLLLQIIRSFLEGSSVRTITGVTYATRSEALRLVWNSIPDSYITFDEMTRICGRKYGITNLRNAHYTYRKAVLFDSPFIQPRSLKQYCRTIIRRLLNDNHLLPDGIDCLGLPNDLKLFLKLQS
ncbi:uncharacterized protein LOC129989152 isoform X2 [Argiope bruennichi]|uniref:uncharacterized protein LOC129989152 isoform X2 n=1 Tax=Argiope bruennichi TaxID=94029 RepID=UPI002494A6B4|nr:uncharacterized protein LOC129989152 isoform X2 [Argiope bruennichi]